MPKLYDIHGAGSVIDIDPVKKERTYHNHKDVVSKYGVNTSLKIKEVCEGGKTFLRCTVIKDQDYQPILKANNSDRQTFKKFGDWAETFRIPQLIFNDLREKGVDVDDHQELINYLEVNYSDFSTTPKRLSKRRSII